MEKWVFMKSCLIHRKNASKVMVLMKVSYQEDPIAVIFVVVAWPGVAYDIDSDKKSSKTQKMPIVPVPEQGFLKSSRGLPEPIWIRISRSRRWDTSQTPKSSQKIKKSKKSCLGSPLESYLPEVFQVSQRCIPDVS